MRTGITVMKQRLTLDKFYPIFPDVSWIKRLVPVGIKTVQLRIKDQPLDKIERQIAEALEVCAHHNCDLIVNDHWKTALKVSALHLHLGQEDIAALTAEEVAQIKDAGLSLGLSTHSTEELDTALSYQPDYVALGPVWETTLKKMKWQPQGLEKLKHWKTLSNLPLVAIGGITLERAPKVFEAGADSIAVVSDIIMNDSPEKRVEAWLELIQC